MMNLGKAIRLCRTQRGLSQLELAIIAEISVSYLSLIERGKRDPTFSTIQGITDGLNIPLSILVFLAADDDDLDGLPTDLREKLSYVALQLMSAKEEGEV